MNDTTMTAGPAGPDSAWLTEWRRQEGEAQDTVRRARRDLTERLPEADAWKLIDALDASKNDVADLSAEFMLEMLACHLPSLAMAIRALAPHILLHADGEAWACCWAIVRD